MILANQLFQNKLYSPVNLEVLESYKLLSETGMVYFPYSGVPLFSPIGHIILNNIKQIIEKALEYYGFAQIYAPLIQHELHMQASGRYSAVKNELFFLQEKYKNFYLTPTNEEFFLSLLGGNLSYRNLPIRFFQIADKFRNIKKPKEILRSKQFLMCDAVSIDASQDSLKESAHLFEQVVATVFEKFGLDYIRCDKNDGQYVDFLILCPEGETKLIKNQSGRFEFTNEQTPYSASSLAMYFIFDCNSLLPCLFTNAQGEKQCVQMGTYGFGIQRCFHAITHQYRDALGIHYPPAIRPFNVSILPVDTKSEEQRVQAKKLYHLLHENEFKPLLDDRHSSKMKERAAFSDFLGVPYKILIGNEELKNNQLTLKSRNSKLEQILNYDNVIESLKPLVKQ